MSFLDHLEEMRWHLVRSLIGIGVGMAALFSVVDQFVERVVLAPMSANFPTNRWICRLDPSFCVDNLNMTLQSIAPTEQFTRAILVSAVGGFVLAFPYIAWELWRFLKPGLAPRERKLTRGSVAVVSLLFFAGVAFAYFVLSPFALSFFANYQLTPDIQNNWRIGKVVGLVVQLCFAGGLLFEMPALSYVLTRMRILHPQMMRKYRKHAIIAVMVLAGLLTPSPDIFNQLLLAMPMLLLYEFSILISRRVSRSMARREAERMAELRRFGEQQQKEDSGDSEPPS